MSTRLNRKSKSSMRSKAHLNYMGELSYDINDPFLRLKCAASSCFFGEPSYYQGDEASKRKDSYNYDNMCSTTTDLTPRAVKHLRKTLNAIDPVDWRELTTQQIMERTIDECLSMDVEKTLQIAVQLRNSSFMRTTPQVIMVRAAMHPASRGTGLILKFAEHIIKRADEPAAQLAYFLGVWGNGGRRKGGAVIPKRLRKAWKKMLESFDEYQLSKYRMDNRMVKTIDVIRLVHAHSPAIDKLINGKAKQTGKTWNDARSNSAAKLSELESWTKSLGKMGHMALLRNLRNLIKAGVEPKTFMPKLVDGVSTGKQIPFRYFSAYRELEKGGVATPYVLDELEECMVRSVSNVPNFSGRTMSLVDNSGSAHGACTSEYGTMKVASIGNLMGVVTGMASEEGYIGVFGDRLETFPVKKRSSVFDQLKVVENVGLGVGHSTENGVWLFWDRAIRNKEHWDHVFVYSDQQAGHGGLYGTNPTEYNRFRWNGTRHIDVPKLIAEYRAKVNPNVKVFLVQIAGYQDTILPEFYKDTYILGGWSPSILNFANEMSQLKW